MVLIDSLQTYAHYTYIPWRVSWPGRPNSTPTQPL
jgi:hypothetical protein